jgi:8-oxo-dGTP diphosphatase
LYPIFLLLGGEIKMTTIYVNWGEEKVKLTWKMDTELPPRELITSVHGFCFQDDKVLLVRLHERGWDFPGGHIEVGESPEQCLMREALEEGYIEGACRLLGYIIVDHHENPRWDENGPYPKVGYQVFYRMDIEEVREFGAQFESEERKFIQLVEVAKHHRSWNELYEEIFCEATKGR